MSVRIAAIRVQVLVVESKLPTVMQTIERARRKCRHFSLRDSSVGRLIFVPVQRKAPDRINTVCRTLTRCITVRRRS